MDTRFKVEQAVIAAADCWARGVLQSDRLLDLTEQNLLDTVMTYDKYMKRNGLDLSRLPPPPHIPHDMDIEEQIPTVRYSEYTTVPSPSRGMSAVKIQSEEPGPNSEQAPDSEDIF
ncbi:hypothetical protein M0R72_02980 [Candidatus Pacearchaeota archaeon]|jgi:hypothetical protein|nr:hypothetical protein [Candidatus Pacearchaeota archaeon]